MDILDEVRVGLLQAQLKWREPEANRRHLAELMGAQAEALDLLVLPETFTTGFMGDAGSSDEGMDGASVAWMGAMAARFDCVMAGSLVIMTPAGRRNRLVWAEPGGRLRFYDKRHLFAHGGEDERYLAGRERVIIEYRGWRICPQICYDIRFPVWCRNRGDYDLLLVVANWPGARIDAWSALLKARAIENQCFVAAVNRVGEDGQGMRYPGRSVLHDALGNERVLLATEEALGIGTVGLQELRELRCKLPFLDDADDFRLS